MAKKENKESIPKTPRKTKAKESKVNQKKENPPQQTYTGTDITSISAVPPALPASPASHTRNVRSRTALLFTFACSNSLLQSVPLISSSKQRSQSVTLYSCRPLSIRVSFNAFL